MITIQGKWADGADLIAIPNYARMNRVGPPHAYPGAEEDGAAARGRHAMLQSKVWI